MERQGVLAADRVVSVSGFTKNILVEQYGVPSEKIEVVHNGIDPSVYSLNESPDRGLWKLRENDYKIVLYFGRITIMKGVDHLIDAAKRVLEYDPKVMFVIAGSGDMEGQVMEQVARLGMSKNVMFLGFLRGRELSAVIRAADLFVTPSVSEPFGLTALESLAHGTPVIVSKQSGVSEVLQHAMKVDFWDVNEMADKILSVLQYSPMKHTLANFGHAEAMEQTWDKAAARLRAIYNYL
jgi:glycosyltransferase involved in cell wall biosynthesis